MVCKAFALLFLGVGFIGCATVSKDSVLVQVGDQKITENDLVSALGPKEKETYLRFKKQQIDKLIAKKLLEQEAKKKQVPYEKFLTEEIFNKSKVTDDEIHAYYKKNKKQFAKKKHAEWTKDIAKLLQDQKAQNVLKTLLQQLASRTQINYYIAEQKVN